ncbi:MAG: hypothetical protein L0H59_17630, partial [Tomitella sp.]|nr:hypothetical protein [Tomitella sp.]
IEATSTTTITATVVALSVAAAGGGKVAVGAAIGISIAANHIGHELLGDPTPVTVQAHVTAATVTAGGQVRLTAATSQTIRAVVVAASVAIAIGGKVGVAVAGSGVLSDNRIAVITAAVVDDGDIDAAVIAVTARDTSTITAFAGAASVAVAFGGNAGIAISIGVSLARNTISSEIEAAVRGASDVTTTAGAVTLSAAGLAVIDAVSAAASLSAAVAGKGAAVGVSGAGAVATNIILTRTRAVIEDSTVTSAGAVTLTARDRAKIHAVIVAASVAVAGAAVGVGVALGAAVARNLIGHHEDGSDDAALVEAAIRRSSVTAVDALILTAIGERSIEALVVAVSMAITGGGVGVGASGSGVYAENRILSHVRALIDGDGSGGIHTGNVGLAASDASGIRSIAIAGAVAAAFGGTGVALSIGVSLAFNEVDGEVAAYVANVDDLTTTSGDVTISATRSGRPASSLGGGLTAADLDDAAEQTDDADADADQLILDDLATALGVTGSLRLSVLQPGAVWQAVTASGTYVITDDDGTLTVADATIDAVSTAAALSVAIGGTAGVSVSGAGAVSDNLVLTQTNALIRSSTVNAAGDVVVTASSTASITATVVAAAVAVGGGG